MSWRQEGKTITARRHTACALKDLALAISTPSDNEKLVTRYLNDPEFQEGLFRVMAQRIYDEGRGVGEDHPASLYAMAPGPNGCP